MTAPGPLLPAGPARGAARRGAGSAAGRRRGGPLVMLALLLGSWGAARTMLWEDPFASLARPLAAASDLLAAAAPRAPTDLAVPPAPRDGLMPAARAAGASAGAGPGWAALPAGFGWQGRQSWTSRPDPRPDPRLAAAHPMLWHAALSAAPGRTGFSPSLSAAASARPGWSDAAPFLPPPSTERSIGRWSLNAWAFWRQGSSGAPVSQGRLPIYGASQAGAVLQYRLAPDSGRDPRLYARAYRALVARGESELALGAALRPVPRLPLRLAGELRYTDAAQSNAWRPAAYVVTEIAPVDLPRGTRLEAYGQAGWVGGPGATAFADGQASVTGEIERVAQLTDSALHLSIGAGAWGGAQEDAQRLDIGPTMRLDFLVGSVPARASIDWRERIGGDAAPESGLAATISTQF